MKWRTFLLITYCVVFGAAVFASVDWPWIAGGAIFGMFGVVLAILAESR